MCRCVCVCGGACVDIYVAEMTLPYVLAPPSPAPPQGHLCPVKPERLVTPGCCPAARRVDAWLLAVQSSRWGACPPCVPCPVPALGTQLTLSLNSSVHRAAPGSVPAATRAPRETLPPPWPRRWPGRGGAEGAGRPPRPGRLFSFNAGSHSHSPRKWLTGQQP